MGRLVCTFMDYAEEVRQIIANEMKDSFYRRQYRDEYPWSPDDEEEEPRHALEADGIVLR